MKNSNEKRCIAHDIIIELYHAKELGQIQLLYCAASLSLKSLDPKAYAETIKNAYEALQKRTKPKTNNEE